MATTTKRKKAKTTRRAAQPTVAIKEEVRMVPARGYGAPARRSAPAPIFVAPRTLPAPTSKRKTGGAGAMTHTTGEKVRKGVAVASFVLGYAERNNTLGVNDLTAKMPVLFGSKKLSMAIGLHLLSRKTKPGGYVDHLATALTGVAFYDLGTHGFGSGGLLSNLGLGATSGDDRNVATF